MLVDCKLNSGRIIRYLIDRNWSGVLEVLFAEHGSYYIASIVDVDDPANKWEPPLDNTRLYDRL